MELSCRAEQGIDPMRCAQAHAWVFVSWIGFVGTARVEKQNLAPEKPYTDNDIYGVQRSERPFDPNFPVSNSLPLLAAGIILYCKHYDGDQLEFSFLPQQNGEYMDTILVSLLLGALTNLLLGLELFSLQAGAWNASDAPLTLRRSF